MLYSSLSTLGFLLGRRNPQSNCKVVFVSQPPWPPCWKGHHVSPSSSGDLWSVAVMVRNSSPTTDLELGAQEIPFGDLNPDAETDLKSFWVAFGWWPAIGKSLPELAVRRLKYLRGQARRLTWCLPGNCPCLQPDSQHRALST